ncbi:MAG: hypothetical protein IJT63_07305 [Lachnospiraceae bacterium]|nr:hypothetical protein [Lachnospiraceae bacterium]
MSQKKLIKIMEELEKGIDYDKECYGNGSGINVYDRRESGRVADSILEWQMNCCACAY